MELASNLSLGMLAMICPFETCLPVSPSLLWQVSDNVTAHYIALTALPLAPMVSKMHFLSKPVGAYCKETQRGSSGMIFTEGASRSFIRKSCIVFNRIPDLSGVTSARCSLSYRSLFLGSCDSACV